MQLLVRSLAGRTLVVQLQGESTDPSVECLHSALLDQHPGSAARGCHLVHGGRVLLSASTLAKHGVKDGSTISQVARLPGGKGGFGAMLRGAGRTGKLTDNFDACRDLNGRRIRHQEAEKRLAEWVAEEKQRELERVAQAHIKQQLRQERQEQIEKMNAAIVREVQATNIKGVKEAVTSGLALVTTTSNKRKNGGDGPAPQRKSLKVWGMEEPDSDSDGDSDDDDREDSGGGVAEGAATAVVTKAEEQVGPPPDEARQEEPKGPDAEDREGSGPLDLSRFETAKDLEVAGLEVLKAELQRHGLKCGGSLTQRAERLFLIKSTPLDQIDKAHFAKK